jgi:hypothetical protein
MAAAARVGVCRDSVYAWRADEPQFREAFEIARKMRVEGFIDEVAELSDEVRKIGADAALDPDLRRSMVRATEISMNKKLSLLEKVNPQKYGNHPAIPPAYQSPLGQLSEEQRRAEVDRAIDAAFGGEWKEPPPPLPPPPVEKAEYAPREFVSETAPLEDEEPEESETSVARLPVRYRPPRAASGWSA